MNLKKYLFVWLKTSALSLETMFASKGASLMYLAGKFIRFFFFLWLLLRIGDQIEKVSGFTVDQLVTFFLVFNLFDIVGQIFFRGVYWFRQEVVSGKFDLTLLKPMSALFQALTTRTDLLDLPLFLVVIGALTQRGIGLGLTTWAQFGLMSAASLLLIAAIHTFVAAIGVLTTEVDHAIMIYRDLSTMARVPIDIYIRPLQVLLTFVVPVAVVMTFPAKAFMDLLSVTHLLLGIGLSGLFFLGCLRLWKYALREYSSASS